MRSQIFALLIFLSFNAFAGPPKTVTLDIKNMTYELCPVTVKKALEKTPGVTKAQIDFVKKTASVTFDPDVVSVGVLTQSTANAGYPSMAREAK